MVSWHEFELQAPEMAQLGARLLAQYHIAYLATVRANGSPRVHPVSPFLLDGRLFVATPPASPKSRDQQRDGRYVLHMLPGEDDAEFSIRGRSTLVRDAVTRQMILDRGPHWVKPDDCLFEYRIEHAASAHWVNVGQPGTYAVRQRWPSG